MPEYELTPELEARKAELLSEIESAFGGVSREGGVSWSETGVMDDRGSESEQQEAKERDTESRWQDLVGDSNWVLGLGTGGFSFLDPIGFRYYLAAAMVRSLQEGEDLGILFHLTLHDRDPRMKDLALERWSLFDDAQKRCVKRFIQFQVAALEQESRNLRAAGSKEMVIRWVLVTADEWKVALDRYWGAIDG